jgi:hypothetical protein
MKYLTTQSPFTNKVYYDGHEYTISAAGQVRRDNVALGVDAPPTNAYVTHTNGSITTSSEYDIVFSFLDSRGFEGRACTNRNFVAPHTCGLVITWDTSDVPSGASVRLYGRGGSAYIADYVLIAEVVPTDSEYSNGQYIWTNGVLDPSNGIYTADDNYTPPTTTNGLLAIYNSMLFVSKNSDVHYSRTGSDVINGFPTRNKMTFENPITGLAVARETLVVLYSNGVSNVTGFDFDSIDIHKTSVRNGCKRKGTALSIKGNVLYVGYDGVYEFDGAAENKISTKVDSLFTTLATNIKAVWTNDHYKLNNGVWLDVQRGNWIRSSSGLTKFRYKTKDFLYTGLPIDDPDRILIDYSNPVVLRVYHNGTARYSNALTATTRTRSLLWLPSGLYDMISFEFDGNTNAMIYHWTLKGLG